MTALAYILLTSSSALAMPYTFTALPTGFTAAAISNAGQIAGIAPLGGLLLPAVLADGSVSFPNTPRSGGSFSSLTGINDAGDLLGLSANGRAPFLLSGGALVPFAAPGNTSAGVQAYGLNNLRQIVGSALVSDSLGARAVGYVSPGNTYAVLGGPDLPPLLPQAINNLGFIVGSTGTGPGQQTQQGFLFQNGATTLFTVPGSSSTLALAINDNGEIAGQYGVAGVDNHGFTLVGGVFSDITGPSGDPFLPVGLNNAGQLVGTFADRGLSYLATPEPLLVPEPASAALLGVLLALTAGACRSRCRLRPAEATVSPAILSRSME